MSVTLSKWGANGTAAIVLGWACVAAGAQLYTPPPPALDTPACVSTKKKPCPAEQTVPPQSPAPAEKFPFPGEPGTDTTKTPDTPAPTTPNAPAANGQKAEGAAGSPAGAFPFPGYGDMPPAAGSDAGGGYSSSQSADDSTGGAAAGASAGKAASGRTKPGSMPDSADDDDDDNAPAAAGRTAMGANATPGRRKMPKVEDTQGREDEDVRVAKFYMSTGNHLAAYNRAKDALKIDGTDADAHLLAAESAAELKKKDEAVAEYQAYLKLEPDGSGARKARKALEKLQEP